MGKLSQRDKDKKAAAAEGKKFVELADTGPRLGHSGSRDNCILSEFMQMRDSKFTSLGSGESEQQQGGSRLSRSSSTSGYSARTNHSSFTGNTSGGGQCTHITTLSHCHDCVTTRVMSRAYRDRQEHLNLLPSL